MEWQPIESAPRDGSVILVWDTGTETVQLVVWSYGEFVETIEEYWAPKGITHWMPPPPPPEGSP